MSLKTPDPSQRVGRSYAEILINERLRKEEVKYCSKLLYHELITKSKEVCEEIIFCIEEKILLYDQVETRKEIIEKAKSGELQVQPQAKPAGKYQITHLLVS